MSRLGVRDIIFSTGVAIACTIVFLSGHVNAKGATIEPPASCTFYGDFEQSKSLKGLDTPIESSGAFFYSCKLGVIWKTLLPIEETLVLNKDGKAARLKNNQVIPFKSRQGKLLGQLINGLIGANADFINKNFDVESSEVEPSLLDSQERLVRQSHVLSPKGRRFKQALSRIELVTPSADPNAKDAPEYQDLVTISLLDRNQQWTHIVSSKKVDYVSDEASLEQCLASNIFSQHECELLEQTDAS